MLGLLQLAERHAEGTCKREEKSPALMLLVHALCEPCSVLLCIAHCPITFVGVDKDHLSAILAGHLASGIVACMCYQGDISCHTKHGLGRPWGGSGALRGQACTLVARAEALL